MYTRQNLTLLKEAIDKLCSSTEGEKYGLRVNLNSTFQKSIKILSGYYAQSSVDLKLTEIRKFKEAYAFNLTEITGKARYYMEKKFPFESKTSEKLAYRRRHENAEGIYQYRDRFHNE